MCALPSNVVLGNCSAVHIGFYLCQSRTGSFITLPRPFFRYRAAREHPGEPVITSLLQASLEQCERESAARKAEIYAITADAIRQLRASVVPERRRRNLRPKATKVLSDWYAANQAQPYPTDEQKRELAKAASVEVDQVSNWFSNRRNRHNKKGSPGVQPR